MLKQVAVTFILILLTIKSTYTRTYMYIVCFNTFELCVIMFFLQDGISCYNHNPLIHKDPVKYPVRKKKDLNTKELALAMAEHLKIISGLLIFCKVIIIGMRSSRKLFCLIVCRSQVIKACNIFLRVHYTYLYFQHNSANRFATC